MTLSALNTLIIQSHTKSTVFPLELQHAFVFLILLMKGWFHGQTCVVLKSNADDEFAYKNKCNCFSSISLSAITQDGALFESMASILLRSILYVRKKNT